MIRTFRALRHVDPGFSGASKLESRQAPLRRSRRRQNTESRTRQTRCRRPRRGQETQGVLLRYPHHPHPAAVPQHPAQPRTRHRQDPGSPRRWQRRQLRLRGSCDRGCAWGFAASPLVKPEEIARITSQVVQVAKANASLIAANLAQFACLLKMAEWRGTTEAWKSRSGSIFARTSLPLTRLMPDFSTGAL